MARSRRRVCLSSMARADGARKRKRDVRPDTEDSGTSDVSECMWLVLASCTDVQQLLVARL